jgi:uncharacterized protein
MRRRQRPVPAYRIFFATDVHGSDRCFRKFIAAAASYGADAIVLGGDVGGKAIVPVVATDAGSFAFNLHGRAYDVDPGDLAEAERMINFGGYYPVRCDESEIALLDEDVDHRERTFERVIVKQVAGWCALAAERLSPKVRCVITPGNDDPLGIDTILRSAPRIECPELEMLELGPVWLASLGNTNRTPWNTPREYDEDELAVQIDAMVGPYADGRPLVFNFHCPPYDSGLDTAAQLDSELRPVMRSGGPVEIPVGSSAVRDAVLGYQPVVGLHGHIHESRGVRRLGNAVCLNPGSEYASGALKGAIVDFDEEGRYVSHLFTSG